MAPVWGVIRLQQAISARNGDSGRLYGDIRHDSAGVGFPPARDADDDSERPGRRWSRAPTASMLAAMNATAARP